MRALLRKVVTEISLGWKLFVVVGVGSQFLDVRKRRCVEEEAGCLVWFRSVDFGGRGGCVREALAGGELYCDLRRFHVAQGIVSIDIGGVDNLWI